MSGANAIHGVVIVGAIHVILNVDTSNVLALSLGFLAVLLVINAMSQNLTLISAFEFFGLFRSQDLARVLEDASAGLEWRPLLSRWLDY